MIVIYFKIAWRTFVYNKVYSVINLVGLTLGLVISMLIFQYVIFENSADRFHADKDQIYRVVIKQTVNKGTPDPGRQIDDPAKPRFDPVDGQYGSTPVWENRSDWKNDRLLAHQGSSTIDL